MKFRYVVAARTVAALLCMAPVVAWAWGATGHRLIGRLAIEQLPQEIPAFLRNADAAETIGEFSREPDRSRGGGLSLDRDLNPGHFINLDDDFTARGIAIDPLPATREAYDNALRTADSDEYRLGFLPYSIIDGWLQLQKDFAYWRAAEAMERHAAKAADRAWFKRDRLRRELLILRDLGYWSHFVGDASQPMHVSVHYDGWGDFANPRGYRTTRGFHAEFEGAFVAGRISAPDILARVVPLRDCECTIQQRTLAYLRASHAEVERLFELEKAGAFTDAGNSEGQDFAARRLAAAVAELRDLIAAAWRGSLAGAVGYPPVPVSNIVTHKVDPLRQMQGGD